MRKRVILFSVSGFLLATMVAWFVFAASQHARLRLTVHFLYYTNTHYGEHVGVVQVSNASPFAVVRGRSPLLVVDSPGGPIEYSAAPTGWNLLEAGECELVRTEPLTNNRLHWRMSVVGQRYGRDDYGVSRERELPQSKLCVWQRQVWQRTLRWLRDHRIPFPDPSPDPRAQFFSDWIEP